jgi:accessory Sec system S-layer assembly protein
MGLFSYFKKSDKVGKDSAVSSSALGQSTNTASKNEVTTKLSLHPSWDVPTEQQYIFKFLANELQPLLPNQLSLSAINIEEEAGKWNVKAFFRSSLPQAIELGEIELIILDANNNKIAAQVFDFKELGTIPAESARPWVFTFNASSLTTNEIPAEGWQLAFNLISLRGHQLDLDASWEQQLPEEQKKALADIVKTLPKLGKTEVNFTGLQIKLQENGNLAASIFIRNGNDTAINLEQLPLEILDANNSKIATGSFKMDPVLSVEANSTKPWTFIFPAELVNAENADLSRWTARVIQNG